MKRTKEEIDELKRQWVYDGCWDLSTTEGFEDHKDELRIFELEHELKHNKIAVMNDELLLQIVGTGSIKLAKYITNIEDRLEELTVKVGELQSKVKQQL